MELEFRGGNRVGTSIMVSTEFIHAVIKQQILTCPICQASLYLLEIHNSEQNTKLPPPRLHASGRGR